MTMNFDRSDIVRAAFSFTRQVRYYFAGWFFYAYYYFMGKNQNLTRPVDL